MGGYRSLHLVAGVAANPRPASLNAAFDPMIVGKLGTSCLPEG
jgi:hypothetical protein